MHPAAGTTRCTKSVAVLTVFGTFDPQYSLTTVVHDQLLSLVEAGYDTRLIALEGFDAVLPCDVDVRACLPRLPLTDYQIGVPLRNDFEDQVVRLATALVPHLDGVDVCLTHDVLFQTWFLPHNAAVRRFAQSRPQVRWLHWMHSAPCVRPPRLKYPHTLRFTGMPNARMVCLNHWDAPQVASMYGIPSGGVRVVYNTRDPRSFFRLSPITNQLIERYDLLDADVLSVYPTRLTPAKQPEVAIALMGQIKAHGCSVRLVFCNSYSNGENEKAYLGDLRAEGRRCGLDGAELVFTSECDPAWELGVSPDVVRELLQLSTVFLFPTVSEACSLVLLEAALTKNLLVLNDEVASLHEIAGEHAIYVKFGSHAGGPHERQLDVAARRILDHLAGERALGAFARVKRRFNRDWVFAHQLRPLIEEK